MAKKNVVVVGAGFAGVAATRRLAKRFKKNADVQITLIDRHSYMTYMTELHEVATDRVPKEAVQYDLGRLFAHRKNVSLVTDNVTNVDHDKNVVTTEHGSYSFDYLILAMGAEPNDFGTPGVKKYGHMLWSLEDAVALKEHFEKSVAQGAIEHDPAKRKALLTFVVVGGGATGVETMGELIDWRPILAKENHLDPKEITLILDEAVPTILNMFDRPDADLALKYMQRKGVDVKTAAPITEVSPDDMTLKDGTHIPTKTVVWTAGLKANTDTSDYNMETGRAGRLITNKYMQSNQYKNTYVAGDLSLNTNEGDRGTPQLVEAAEQTGNAAAESIVAAVNGTTPKAMKSSYSGSVISIGSHYSVAVVFKHIHLSGWFATIMKHLINLLYFIETFAGYYLYQYSMHEFFRNRNGRTPFWGHISRYGNVLWSVPLRIFYAAMWLVDCWSKVQGSGSWFSGKLRLPFTWLYPKVASAATSGASSASSAAKKVVSSVASSTTTGASQAASTAKTAVKAAASTTPATPKEFFSLSYDYGKQPMMVFKHLPKWYESITKFFMPNKSTALFMQEFMTIVEIGIAFCILFGLFTWLANAATIGLVAVFCLSGMFYWVNIWMPFVALALMNGSGRSFGLDYWVVPWLQKHLGHWWYGDLKPLYNGPQK
ncbi:MULTISPECIES: NAD(P)/FAD-dependent oxidoreductase [Loigolactobacillus]|uniref:NADH:ubiquinone reductase (non-electrogenic) n=1 Tax=Loigolactobacillus backii TaxID=375175 RepID=A0A192H3D0_9LACO|nr:MULTISPECIES: NAD(P)/FAD-dependent oxidoreductase [Loigolactobacillus]ANK59088.1 NADH dehydrogenase [Loigolactobacillus backii]ANK62466.1 NADH dehydrogenase [Loigolactobacillus backii]ANK64077.1 NADH dehydrogenase [Loigolactobacillus backii]ANK67529.1 NADH dehydrogenase [Loigolactobacillus backii]ANK70522.1 NADH dehydrogenase [Loigolactobacillus backii]